MSFTHKLKLLVICSKNQWRSPTAERIYQHDSRIEVRSAGTSQHAKHRVSVKDIEWADLIACMETKHKQYIQRTFDKKLLPQIVVFNIEDQYKTAQK